jgi:hypothetical protein
MGHVIETLTIIVLTTLLLVPVGITALAIGNIAMFAALIVVVVAITATVIYTAFEKI